jgi:Domain of unknown function (DUF1707)/Cell wall-active antibiotics response 4TMS YvqF
VDEGLPAVRVGDAERERAAERVRVAAGEGRLTLEELSDRLDGAYRARTAADLEPLLADLPEAAAPARRRGSPTRWVVSIMGGASRKGRWRVGRSLNLLSIMGGADLDLRAAEVPGDELEITAISVMGGASIIVPTGVDVEVTGFSFMGGKSVRLGDEAPSPGAPLVRVRAFSLMGGVDVVAKPSRRQIPAA